MSGVATANTPRGAVASELAKDGKKKTTFLEGSVDLGIDLPSARSLASLYRCASEWCQKNVPRLSLDYPTDSSAASSPHRVWSVLRHRGIDPVSPGQDAAGQVGRAPETRLAQ